MTTALAIDGMSCDHCVRAVRQALEGLPGVTRVEVEVGAARIEGDAVLPALVAALEAEGYAARLA
ncbi:MAG: cation transporter [Candidatus Sericytochromatia bacterium]|nr:cation transporter [Candidatus Sericytochromatia bacterium]